MTEQIIENRMPPVGNHFPTTHYKDKRRKSGYSARHCKRKWLEKYYFMCFSPMNNGIYFLACTLFLVEMKYYKDDSTFVMALCRDYKHFLEYWQIHEQCQYHQISKDKMHNFVSSHYDPSFRKDTKIPVQTWKKMLQSWCPLLSAWRQEITIRGHREDTTST